MELSSFKPKWFSCLDKSLFKMKESKIIELKNKVQGLTKVVRNLIQEVHSCISMSQGTLTALQLHLGKEEWDKIVEELKEREKRLKDVEQSMEKGS
tara:strand:- start:272 stop:559 length:288 start_codon:yes stop_codon:yes gene_type:complete